MLGFISLLHPCFLKCSSANVTAGNICLLDLFLCSPSETFHACEVENFIKQLLETCENSVNWATNSKQVSGKI